MKNETKVAPKPKKQKESVTIISYSIKMVIPTGQYANIQPEIIVKAKTVEEAHEFIAPHMNKLWKEYYLVNDRRPDISVAQCQAKPADPIITEIGTKIGDKVPEGTVSAVQSPASSVALIKATQAINSCLSLDALDLINSQVLKSVKLSHEDKESLIPLLQAKSIELFDKNEKQ